MTTAPGQTIERAARVTLRDATAATEAAAVEAMRLYDRLEDLDRLILVSDPARPGYWWPVSVLDEVDLLDGYGTEDEARAAKPAASPYRWICAQWYHFRQRP